MQPSGPVPRPETVASGSGPHDDQPPERRFSIPAPGDALRAWNAVLDEVEQHRRQTLAVLFRHARVLTCSGSNTAPELAAAGSGGYYFRTVPSDRFQGPALARLVLGEGRKRIGRLDLEREKDRYGAETQGGVGVSR